MGDITSARVMAFKSRLDASQNPRAAVAPYGIHVNGVAPHAIETEMSAEWSPEKRKSIVEAILSNVWKAGGCGRSVLFLASDAAAFITGEILDVNGGFLMIEGL